MSLYFIVVVITIIQSVTFFKIIWFTFNSQTIAHHKARTLVT